MRGATNVAREYIARDPRTGRPLTRGSVKDEADIRLLLPPEGAWRVVPEGEIIELSSGTKGAIELPRTAGGGFARRGDGILALHRVSEAQTEEAHSILLECLDDDDPKIRTLALSSLPSFSLRKHEGLLQCLSDRLIDDEEDVRSEAMVALKKMAPIFPSGCEMILRRELRDTRKRHRDNAFSALKMASESWTETGCLHIDELIREEDVDLRRRGSKILRVLAPKSSAEVWDLIGWCLEDQDQDVRRNAARTLNALAGSEPRIAAILVEVAMSDDDSGVRKSAIGALKRLDMQSPRVAKMILDGARDRDYNLRKACIELLTIVLSGNELRETAAELLKQETRTDLRKKLSSLSIDIEMEGSEEEKNRFLAALDNPTVSEEDDPDAKVGPEQPMGEHHKQELGRPESEGSP
ncbi:MAG: HEAT repeat domain-containing protein [Candidatus Thermoplasmatota archaeon]|nr:HEAT repeat domain-containing protein [Candidatus Thermoplasmatota archaeon]MED5274023.1 HEAT repeat domain-containing protein [Candidatus Thermoplasmatota archaeon]